MVADDRLGHTQKAGQKLGSGVEPFRASLLNLTHPLQLDQQ